MTAQRKPVLTNEEIRESVRETAKRWSEELGTNSKHVRIGFAEEAARDALAAMQRERALAQIAVLEEMLEREMVSMRHDNDYRVRAVPQVSIINKIAALRKELER